MCFPAAILTFKIFINVDFFLVHAQVVQGKNASNPLNLHMVVRVFIANIRKSEDGEIETAFLKTPFQALIW